MPTQSHFPIGNSRLSGLELLRFISAISILVWHYQQFLFVGAAPIGLVVEQQPFYWLLFPFYNLGHLGVQVFWCISGFVFFYKYRRAIEAHEIKPTAFFWLRFSRLYPLHILTLLIVASLQIYRADANLPSFVYMKNDLTNFIGHLFMANGWFFFERFSFNGPVWSVSTEVLIYFAFFFAASRYRLTLPVSVGVSAVCLLIMLIGSRHASVPCLMLFFMGGAAQLICEEMTGRLSSGLSMVGAALLACAGFYAVSSGLVSYKPMTYLVLGISTSALLVLFYRYEGLFQKLGGVPEMLGSLTYSSYLIHFPLTLSLVTASSVFGFKVPFYEPVFFIGWMGFVLVMSWFVFTMFEAPMQAAIRQRLKTRAVANDRSAGSLVPQPSL